MHVFLISCRVSLSFEPFIYSYLTHLNLRSRWWCTVFVEQLQQIFELKSIFIGSDCTWVDMY